MADRSLRGSRLGATSYETDFGIELAPREDVSYDCPKGHTTTVPFLPFKPSSVWVFPSTSGNEKFSAVAPISIPPLAKVVTG